MKCHVSSLALASPPPVIPTGAGRKARGVACPEPVEGEEPRRRRPELVRQAESRSLRSLRSVGMTGGGLGNIGNIISISRNNVSYPPDLRPCPEPVEEPVLSSPGSSPRRIEGSLSWACRRAEGLAARRRLRYRSGLCPRDGAATAINGGAPVRSPARSPTRSPARSLTRAPAPRPHRLVDQDAGLSRRKQGFEPPWGRQRGARIILHPGTRCL